MSSSNAIVIIYLGLINFVASVFQGICGFGDIVALQVLWHVGSSIAPGTFHGTALGDNDVRTVAYLSYVRSFFMQIAFTALLFYEERQVNRKRSEEGLPPKASNFNWQFTLSLMLPMIVGAYVGVETVDDVNEATLRIVLGVSSFFFALTLLSLHMMQRLETRRIQEVIKEDLVLMRTSQEVQRREETRILEAAQQRKARRAHRRRMQRERRRQLQIEAAAANKAADAADAALGNGNDNRDDPSETVRRVQPLAHAVPVSPIANDGAAEHPMIVLSSPTNVMTVLHRPGGASASSSSAAAMAQSGNESLPQSQRRSATGRNSKRPTPAVSPNRQSVGDYPAVSNELERYIRVRLEEISQEDGRQSTTAAVTLQAIREIDELSHQPSHSSHRRRHRGTVRFAVSGTSPIANTSSSSSSTCSSRSRSRSGSIGSRGSPRHDDSETGYDVGEGDDAGAMTNLHHSFSVVGEFLNVPMNESELTKSMAGVARASAGQVNVAMRERQQQQLEALQRDAAKTGKRWKKIRFVRMDGAVLSGAVVSSFFGGLLGSYTGVGIPAQMIFVLAMNISGSLFKINYAASNVFPSTLRFALGAYDGIFDNACFPFYVVTVLCGAAGLVVGVACGQRTAVNGFFMSVIVSLLLTALAMVTDNPWVLVIAVCLAIAALVHITRHDQLPPERQVPPPPPNTPATAGEIQMFEDYWEACAQRMEPNALESSESFGSDLSAPIRRRRKPKEAVQQLAAMVVATARDGRLPHHHQSGTSRNSSAVDVVVSAEEDAPPLQQTETQVYCERDAPPPLSVHALSREEPRHTAGEEEEGLGEGDDVTAIVPVRAHQSTWLKAMYQMTLMYPKDPENAKAQKILAVAALVGIPLSVEHTESSDVTRSEDPDFLNYCDPCGQYPILRLDEEPGITLFDANAIMRHIARLNDQDSHHVYGRTPFEASQVDAWIDFSATEIDAANAPYLNAVFPSLQNNYKRADAASVNVPDAASEGVEKVLAGLDEVLNIRTFLVGERLSIADVAVAFSVHLVYRCNKKFGDGFAKKYRAVYRHYNTVMRHPQIKDVLRKEGATIGPLRA